MKLAFAEHVFVIFFSSILGLFFGAQKNQNTEVSYQQVQLCPRFSVTVAFYYFLRPFVPTENFQNTLKKYCLEKENLTSKTTKNENYKQFQNSNYFQCFSYQFHWILILLGIKWNFLGIFGIGIMRILLAPHPWKLYSRISFSRFHSFLRKN